MIQRILSHNLIRYILVGGGSFAIEMGLILALTYLVHVNPVLSVGIAFWAGLVISFVLQKIVAFGDRSKSKRQLTAQTIQYAVLVGVNYLFTLSFVWATTSLIGVFFARAIALAVTTAWNYVIYSRVIFKKR